MNEIVIKFLLVGEDRTWNAFKMCEVLVDHLLKTKKEQKNSKKHEIQDILIVSKLFLEKRKKVITITNAFPNILKEPNWKPNKDRNR